MKPLCVLLIGVASLATGNVVPTAQDRIPDSSRPSSDVRDDDEEPPVVAHGLHFRWPAAGRALLMELAEPVVPLTVLNLDDVSYLLQVRAREDAGSLETRRMGTTLTATIGARASVTLPIRFGSELPAELTHSAMVAASVTGCPSAGGPCISGGAEPLFFHLERGRFVVYGEDVLCQRFSCGALRATVRRPERGTWRVMGGGPLLRVPRHEEPDSVDEGTVPGGER